MDPQLLAQCAQTVEFRNPTALDEDGLPLTVGGWTEVAVRIERRSVRNSTPDGGVSFEERIFLTSQVEIPKGSEVRVGGTDLHRVELSEPVPDEYGNIHHYETML